MMNPMVIVRKCKDEENPRAVIEHCFVPRFRDKVEALKKRHTWFLRDERFEDLGIGAGNFTREAAWNKVLEKVRAKDRG